MPRKNLFDSIVMFGKTLPEIMRNAGLNEDEIEILRKKFNDETNEAHIYRVETHEVSHADDTAWEDEEIEENPKLQKLKASMEKGFTPPEDKE